VQSVTKVSKAKRKARIKLKVLGRRWRGHGQVRQGQGVGHGAGFGGTQKGGGAKAYQEAARATTWKTTVQLPAQRRSWGKHGGDTMRTSEGT